MLIIRNLINTKSFLQFFLFMQITLLVIIDVTIWINIIWKWKINIRKNAFISRWLLYFLYLRGNKIVLIGSWTLEFHMRWITDSTFKYLFLRLYFIPLKIWFIRWFPIERNLYFFIYILIKWLAWIYLWWRYKSWFIRRNSLKSYWRPIRIFWCFFLSKYFFRILIINFFKLISFILIFIRTDS